MTSFSNIIFGVVIAYVIYSIWSVSQLFISPSCSDDDRCLYSYLRSQPELTLHVFSSVKSTPRIDSEVQLVSIQRDIKYLEPWEVDLTIDVPQSTRQNGTLQLYLVVVPSKSWENSRWSSLMNNKEMVFTRVPVTQLHVPESYIFNLVNDEKKSGEVIDDRVKRSAKPVTHLRTQVTFNILTDPLSIPMENIPGEIHNRLRLSKGMVFLPVIQYNFLETKLEHLKLMQNSTETIKLKYSPINLGKLRFVIHVEEAMKSLKKFGFSSKDIDDVKNIFAGTNLYLLSATIVIVTFHLLFDFLAFKNDVSFWRNKSSMEGLSSRTVMWRAFSQAVVFLYLLDEQASMIILVPGSIGVLIEFWKVFKVLRRRKSAEISESERKTDQYDAESMKYLSFLLYPLCICGAIYSLFYQPHKSWYSWCIHSLVNGVYAFGFLFMLPQLFVNYRLKSVAALPWRAFMYKAFNTFIDDVFAFIITMPTAHRVACFRDDVIFLVYLYQRCKLPALLLSCMGVELINSSRLLAKKRKA